MIRLLYAVLLLGLLAGLPVILSADEGCSENLDFEFRKLGGDARVRLCEAHRGQVVLVVNTASRCGYTYQYDGLEKLYARYRGRGLVVIGFPSNDFGGQEPGSELQIKEFCRTTYGVEFPMYEKTRVRKGDAHPFFDLLAAGGGGYPAWNFHKYLIDRQGRIVAGYRSDVEPLGPELTAAIERAL